MKRIVLLLVGLPLILALPSPHQALASWAGNNCDGTHYDDYYVKRSEAQSYASKAAQEGYEWGGGCWNNNNEDDTPDAPDSSGEGPDCSGFTFKAWELRNGFGKEGFEKWERLYEIHGPWTSYDFHSPNAKDDPFFKLDDKNVNTTIYMDAFAKDGHVAMIYVDGDTPFGLDLMIEALGDDPGTGKFYESYRSQSEYVGVRREDWTDDCWPNCPHPSPSLVVVS
jgi:hypothetical protein